MAAACRQLTACRRNVAAGRANRGGTLPVLPGSRQISRAAAAMRMGIRVLKGGFFSGSRAGAAQRFVAVNFADQRPTEAEATEQQSGVQTFALSLPVAAPALTIPDRECCPGSSQGFRALIVIPKRCAMSADLRIRSSIGADGIKRRLRNASPARFRRCAGRRCRCRWRRSPSIPRRMHRSGCVPERPRSGPRQPSRPRPRRTSCGL